jgi:hypothetical protein
LNPIQFYLGKLKNLKRMVPYWETIQCFSFNICKSPDDGPSGRKMFWMQTCSYVNKRVVLTVIVWFIYISNKGKWHFHLHAGFLLGLLFSPQDENDIFLWNGLIFTGLCRVISQKTQLFITTAVRTSNPTCNNDFQSYHWHGT